MFIDEASESGKITSEFVLFQGRRTFGKFGVEYAQPAVLGRYDDIVLISPVDVDDFAEIATPFERCQFFKIVLQQDKT